MKIFKILRLSGKRVIFLTGLILLIFLGFNLTLGKKQTPLQFTEVKKQDIKTVVSASGTLTGKNIAHLKFRSGGNLAYINVKAGDEVRAFQTIAGLNTQDLSIKLQQAQNTLRDKQATVDKTLDDVKDHSKDETFTQRQTRTAAEVARDNAYDAVKGARRDFQDAVLVSPIAGVVTESPFVAGQNVSSSDAIAQIVDFSQILFEAEIDEADIGKISLGQKAEVSFDAYPGRIFEGEVWEIIPQTNTTSSGATVVTVRINLGEVGITQIQGLSGQAVIILSEAKNVLTIPIEALRDDDTVLVESNRNLEAKKVVSGIRSDTDVEIKEGLSENDKVLLNPPSSNTAVQRSRSPLQRIINLHIGGREQIGERH